MIHILFALTLLMRLHPQESATLTFHTSGSRLFISGTERLVSAPQISAPGSIEIFDLDGKPKERLPLLPGMEVVGIKGKDEIVVLRNKQLYVYAGKDFREITTSPGVVFAKVAGKGIIEFTNEDKTIWRTPTQQRMLPFLSLEGTPYGMDVTGERMVYISRRAGKWALQIYSIKEKQEPEARELVSRSGRPIDMEFLARSVIWVDDKQLLAFAQADSFTPEEREGVPQLRFAQEQAGREGYFTAKQAVILIDLQTGKTPIIAEVHVPFPGDAEIFPFWDNMAVVKSKKMIFITYFGEIKRIKSDRLK
jgi:hypothetical protein